MKKVFAMCKDCMGKSHMIDMKTL